MSSKKWLTNARHSTNTTETKQTPYSKPASKETPTVKVNHVSRPDPRPEWVKKSTYRTLFRERLLPKSDMIWDTKTDMYLSLSQRQEDKNMFLHLRQFTDDGSATKNGIIIPIELLPIFGKAVPSFFDSEQPEKEDEELPSIGESKVFGHLTLVSNSTNMWFMLDDKTNTLPRYAPCLRLSVEEWVGFIACCQRLHKLDLVDYDKL